MFANEPHGRLYCNECGECFHYVIFSNYDPDGEPNGTWFELLKLYREEAWSAFPNNDTAIKGAELWCPGCGSVYTDIHNRIYWYNNDGKYLGKGPKKYKQIYRKLYMSKDERKKAKQKKKQEAAQQNDKDKE